MIQQKYHNDLFQIASIPGSLKEYWELRFLRIKFIKN